MNLFFKLLSLVIGVSLCLWCSVSLAVTLNGIYMASCQREIGVILNVNEFEVKFLNVQGKLLQIPRYEVIYMAYYPLNVVPLAGKVALPDTPPLQVKTKIDNEIIVLLVGWPIDFTKDRISFLTIDGKEAVIDRNSIWDIAFLKKDGLIDFSANGNLGYQFVHPFAFRECPLENKQGDVTKSMLKVYPQQILSDPVVIKREMDRLMDGYRIVKRYTKEKRFYPVPMVYNDKTYLGMWYNVGSRYGSSATRANNFLPFLINERADGPFDYQQVIHTGSGPFAYSVHEEAQNHFVYAFKASYFHMYTMVDPNIVLVGRNYSWQKADFTQADDRYNDSALFEMGFDFGHWSVQFFITHAVSVGVFAADQLETIAASLPRIGLSYHNHLFKIEASGLSGMTAAGDEDNESFGYSYFRANLFLYVWSKMATQYSLIYRKLTYRGDFDYTGNSLTHYGALKYQLNSRYQIGTYIGIEDHHNDFTAASHSDGRSNIYFKGGIFASLGF